MRRPATVGILHPGGMGGAVAAAIGTAGHPVRWCAAGRSAATGRRAAAAGLTAVPDLAALVSAVDVRPVDLPARGRRGARRRGRGHRLRELAGALVPPVAGGLDGLAAIAPLEHPVVHSDQWPVALGLALLAARSLAFAAVDLATMRLVAPAMVADLLAGVRDRLARRDRRRVPA